MACGGCGSRTGVKSARQTRIPKIIKSTVVKPIIRHGVRSARSK